MDKTKKPTIGDVILLTRQQVVSILKDSNSEYSVADFFSNEEETGEFVVIESFHSGPVHPFKTDPADAHVVKVKQLDTKGNYVVNGKVLKFTTEKDSLISGKEYIMHEGVCVHRRMQMIFV